ncbi:4Fe-4S binding protein [Anaerosporobacter faecicola]|uniref:4Fe-4S binding protein n=1 Tax=Anaerosporobacter faecicola TaxID=2718714 RepID=UPI001439DE0D|nr:hypothetical protein [Anaerosporobacter faecicola]
MRKKILYVITVITFPLMVFNFLAVLCVPFLRYIDAGLIHNLMVIEVSMWCMIFLSSLFFQKAHCSHSCAVSGVFEIISNLKKDKDIMNTKYPKVLKYIVTSLWFLGAGYVFVNALGRHFTWFDAPAIFSDPFVVLYYMLIFISGVLCTSIGKSKVDHFICPLSPWIITGSKLGKKMRLPSLTIVTDSSKCVKCRRCSKACIINQDVCQKVVNDHFDQQECMNCFECVNACKTGALKRNWLK